MSYLISVYLHIICAAIWIGGMLFLPLVVLPTIKNHPDRVKLLYKTGIRFRVVGWIVLAILLITGLTNMHLRGLEISVETLTQTAYGQLVGYKLIIFVLVLALGAWHDFHVGKRAIEKMERGESSKFRQVARWSGRLNLLLALAAAFIGLILSRGGVIPV